ncbi:MAG TPA: PEP-CTERM sorting domain-containing protein [Candidatus Dormibacteraeota bacterium]|nr:PEP-CTERM sorting domain-containing protein [Candidatus Dormibacteraeota bacterium]
MGLKNVARVVAVLGLVCLFAPTGLFASPLTCGTGVACAYFWDGTATGGTTGLSMTGPNSGVVNQIDAVLGQNLGTVSFTTGKLLLGSLSGGGYFAGGTMTITANGSGGFNGTLFSGEFGSSGSPLQWTYLGQIGKNGQYEYELSGTLAGSFEGFSGRTGTAQLFFYSKTKYAGGALTLVSGAAQMVTPEPGSMSLLATGLSGLGFFFRRRTPGQTRR